MLKVGITGGIGSGKTTVCQIFECLHVPVFYADVEAKRLMSSDPELKSKISSLFGKKAYAENGQLNRKYISSRVFSDKSLLSKLNQLVHPAVFQAAEKWFKSKADQKYALYEAALIFETNSQDRFDQIITVTAPKKMRIQRVVMRDKVSSKSVEDRMKNQMSQWAKLKISNYQIRNNGKKLILPQILYIHHDLLFKSMVK
jgi:dephospho-CoA kinase